MNRRQLFAYTVFALSGLALAVGLTTIATSLTSQRIGLQDEPLNAGKELAPERSRAETPVRERSERPDGETRTATAPAPQPAPAPVEDEPEAEFEDDDNSGSGSDSSGQGRGRGRGRGGDDDD